MTFFSLKKLYLDLFFPRYCLGCRKEGPAVCMSCQQRVQMLRFQICPHCHLPTPSGRLCRACQGKSFLDGLIVGASYKDNPLLKKAIQKFKYKGWRDLDEFLVDILKRAVEKYFITNVMAGYARPLLEPVPLHWLRQNYRGCNQAELLARKLGERKNWPVINLLQRQKMTPPQVGKPREERVKAMKNAFRLKKEITGKIPKDELIFLIDDVSSTGATLQACAKVLKQAGFKQVWGLVVARD